MPTLVRKRNPSSRRERHGHEWNARDGRDKAPVNFSSLAISNDDTSVLTDYTGKDKETTNYADDIIYESLYQSTDGISEAGSFSDPLDDLALTGNSITPYDRGNEIAYVVSSPLASLQTKIRQSRVDAEREDEKNIKYEDASFLLESFQLLLESILTLLEKIDSNALSRFKKHRFINSDILKYLESISIANENITGLPSMPKTVSENKEEYFVAILVCIPHLNRALICICDFVNLEKCDLVCDRMDEGNKENSFSCIIAITEWLTYYVNYAKTPREKDEEGSDSFVGRMIKPEEFQMMVAVLAEGALLVQNAQTFCPSSLDRNSFDDENSRSSECLSENMVDDTWSICDESIMSERATTAARILRKIPPQSDTNITKKVPELMKAKSKRSKYESTHLVKSGTRDTSTIFDREALKKLRDWILNVDAILSGIQNYGNIPIGKNIIQLYPSLTNPLVSEGTASILSALVQRKNKVEKHTGINFSVASNLRMTTIYRVMSRLKTKMRKTYVLSLIFIIIPLFLSYILKAHLSAVCLIIFTLGTLVNSHFTKKASRFRKSDGCFPNLPSDPIVREDLQKAIIDAVLEKNTSKVVVLSSVDSKSPSHTIFSNVTIIEGAPGFGKKTLTTMIAKKQKIKRKFPDGVVWLCRKDIESIPDHCNALSPKDLIYFYKRIFSQLNAHNSSIYKSAPILEPLYFPPENEQDATELMDGLKREMMSSLNLERKRILLILNGFENSNDLKWFQFAVPKNHRSRESSLISSPFQILTTMKKHPQGKNALLGSKVVSIGPLNKPDSIEMLIKEANSSVGKVIKNAEVSTVSIVKYCSHNPLALRFVARTISMTMAPTDCWYNLHQLLGSNSSVNIHQDGYHAYILNQCFSCLCADNDAIAEILKLCFVAFVAVFYDGSFNFTQPVPLCMVYSLWEGLMRSDEVTDHQFFSIECSIVSSLHRERGVHSKCCFIREQLESLGLISSTKDESQNGQHRIIGLYLNHGVIRHSVALLLSMEGEDAENFPGKREMKWVALFIDEYKGIMVSGWNADNSELSEGELTFLVRHMPRFLILSGFVSDAFTLLADGRFIKDRLLRMGLFDGTNQHITDAQTLLDNNPSGEKDECIVLSKKNSIILVLERLAEHLVSTQEETEPGLRSAGMLLYTLGHFLHKQEWLNEAFMVYQEALNAAKNNLAMIAPISHPANVADIGKEEKAQYRLLSRILSATGLIFYKKNDMVEAIRSFSESLHLGKIPYQGRSPKRSDNGRTLHALGCAYFSRRDFGDALQTYKKALKVRVALYGPLHVDVAQTMFNIGIVYYEQGKVEESIKKMGECLHIRKKMLGADHLDVAHTLKRMGDMYQEKGKTQEAIAMFKEAARIWNDSDSKECQINYADCLYNMGVLYRECGTLDAAMRSYQESLCVREGVLGPNSLDVAQTLNDIGIVHCKNGDNDDAIKAYARALRVRKQTRGDEQERFGVAQTLHNIGIVLRKNGDTDEAMTAFTEALWVAKALDIEPPTKKALKERCCVLFGVRAVKSPCVSARIFSCASLMVDDMMKKERRAATAKSADTRFSNHSSKSRAERDKTALMNWIRPLLPLLTAFVDAEIVAIGANSDRDRQDLEEPRSKGVRFCTYDFSSVTTPVDLLPDSNVDIELCIRAMRNILEEMELLCKDANETRDGVSNDREIRVSSNSELAQLLLVLHAISLPAAGVALRHVCAEAMPDDTIWPPARFIHAAEQYKLEFEAIVALTESRNESNKCATPTREHLSTYIGFAIRFHLRRLFDPPPSGYTVTSKTHPQRDFSTCRANTHEFVELSAPDGIPVNDDTPMLWDAPISYVLNTALRHIHSYFSCIDDGRNGPPDPASKYEHAKLKRLFDHSGMSVSTASRRALDFCLVTDSDVEDILFDIRAAQIYLAAARASKFVLSLYRHPGVKDAVEESGGWGCVEYLGNVVWKHDLSPDEAHFILLRDVKELMGRLQAEMGRMATNARASQRILKALWKRFTCKSKKNWQNNNERLIYEALVDGSSSLNFPVLATPEYEEICGVLI